MSYSSFNIPGCFNALPRKRLALLGIFAFLFLLRITFTFISPLRGDELEYTVIAKTISFNSQNLNLPVEDPLVKHPLLAVYAIKASISIFGDNGAAYRLFALIAGCLTLIILYKFLLKTQSATAGLLGLMLLGLNVFHIGASIANSLTMFFSICVIYLFWKGIIENKMWPIIGSGIVMGMGYLNKEIIAGLLVCFFLYGWIYHNNKKLFFKKIFVLLLTFFLTLLPYIVYIIKFGSCSRLLNKSYMLDFSLNLSGIDFYLARLRGMLQGVDYKTLLSWEHYPMGVLSGLLFAGGTITGIIQMKGHLEKLMAVIFIFFVVLISFFGHAEHTWAQITIFPAVFFTSAVLARWYQKNIYAAYLVRGIIICLTVFSLIFICNSKFLYPPNRFAAVVDYDTDLMKWYYRNGRLEDAMKEAEVALSICPNEVRITNLMGIFHATKGDMKRARSYFQKALSINSDFQPAQLNMKFLESMQKGNNDSRKFVM